MPAGRGRGRSGFSPAHDGCWPWLVVRVGGERCWRMLRTIISMSRGRDRSGGSHSVVGEMNGERRLRQMNRSGSGLVGGARWNAPSGDVGSEMGRRAWRRRSCACACVRLGRGSAGWLCWELGCTLGKDTAWEGGARWAALLRQRGWAGGEGRAARWAVQARGRPGGRGVRLGRREGAGPSRPRGGEDLWAAPARWAGEKGAEVSLFSYFLSF
jgi:hypothetical protein